MQLRERDPDRALQILADRGIRAGLAGGRPHPRRAFLTAGLVDEVVAYLAPALLGSGPPVVGDLGISTIADVLRLHPYEITTIGPDIRIGRRSPLSSRRRGT